MQIRDDSSHRFSKFIFTAVVGAGLAFPGGALADEIGSDMIISNEIGMNADNLKLHYK